MTLTKDQLRRLKNGMADPIEGRESLTVRKDHILALAEMIDRRERDMMDFVMQIEAELEGGQPEKALQRCRAFWRDSIKKEAP